MDHAGIARSLERLSRLVNDLAERHTPILTDKLNRIGRLAQRQTAQAAELKRVRGKLVTLVKALPQGSPARAHRQDQLDRVEARIESLTPKIELVTERARQLRDLALRLLGLIEAENRVVEGVLGDLRTWLAVCEEPLRRQVNLARRILTDQGLPADEDENGAEAGESGIDLIVEQVLGENAGEELELLLADMDDAATVGS
jgi:chromosome segregation ATPase